MQHSKANRIYAESMADELLERFQVFEPPVPVNQIADKLGLKIFLATFDNDDIAGFLQESPLQITVNKAHAPTRQAFTVAHEIGHYVLHRRELAKDPDVGVLFRKPIGGEIDPIEIEANAFAADLLVPEKLLFRYHDYSLSTAQLAAIFGVSPEVMGYRLRDTGLR